MTTQPKNEVLREGLPLAAPEWSHENHNTRFYRFFLQVPRLSGTPDVLPVLLPEAQTALVVPGAPLRLRGQLRSFNNRSGVGNKLVLTVYALDIQPGLGEACNQILLSGSLCKPPIFRRTPLGRSICDLMLASPRRYGRAPDTAHIRRAPAYSGDRRAQRPQRGAAPRHRRHPRRGGPVPAGQPRHRPPKGYTP